MSSRNITIKILVDNKVKDDLIQEHGFALWIEAYGTTILCDTGHGNALIHNAASLGCDLSHADALVLSHGHYDHTGGVSHVLRYNPAIRVYCHSDLFLSRYSIRDGMSSKNISIPYREKLAILSLPAEQVTRITQPLWIDSYIGLSGPIPRRHLLENTGGPFFLDTEGTRPDPIEDDMAMWIQSDRGLVIITGCCHSGLINTVNHIRRISGHERISAIIGGFHLEHASHQRLEATCQALREWKVDTIVPCHCTGNEAVSFFRSELGERVKPGYAGMFLEL